MVRQAFPESPRTALAVVGCESGFKMIQSNHIQPYGREKSYGIFQIHEPAWGHVAEELGLDFKNNIRDNIEMARYVYEQSGWSAWSCYNNLAMR